MDQKKVHHYYLRLSVINLVLALVLLFFSSKEELSENIKTALSVYVVFHLMYQIVSRFYLWAFETFADQNSTKTKVLIKVFIFFSWIIIILPFCSAALTLYSAISQRSHSDLFNLIFLSGMVLGGHSMKSKFKAKLDNNQIGE